MIEWKKLDPLTAPDEIEEEAYLIYLTNSGRVISATHDAMNRYFYYDADDAMHVLPYRYVSHYAEMEWPDDGPMISECKHGKVLVCEECAKRHQPTE